MGPSANDIMALIRRAPWREAVTYRDSWPHEYVVIKKDRQEDLLAAFCGRITRGEGVECQFFRQKRKYLFLGEHKYWIMVDCADVDLDKREEVLNRALLYRDRRDFVIRPGDTGTRQGDPTMANTSDGFEQLDVRTKWKDEARNFTPWLAENIEMLGDALGMKLETVQMELPIGRFFLDIRAREIDEKVTVAIENQLEEADLHHLGQLLTYATGCGAGIAIWVAPEFGYELARALHKLNEWTDERIRFFGVKVEYVRKHGVATAEPRFRVVVSPGGWNKEYTLPLGEMPLDARRHHDFFQPLVTKLQADNFADSDRQNYDYTDRFFPSRVDQDFGYLAHFYRVNSARVTLHIPTENKELDKQVFDKLKADRDQIEASVDAGPNPEWHWSRYNSFFYSAISVSRAGSVSDPPDKLEETRAWMLDLLPKFKAVFDPRLEDILGSE